MIKTLGLTHIALPVKNVTRAAAFYKKVFGAREMYNDAEFIQIQTPGSKDIIVFIKKAKPSVKSNPGFHFGFRLPKPTTIQAMIKTIKNAGGRIKEAGEFVPGEPYVFFFDPDGYEIEIWFENIPPSLNSFN